MTKGHFGCTRPHTSTHNSPLRISLFILEHFSFDFEQILNLIPRQEQQQNNKDYFKGLKALLAVKIIKCNYDENDHKINYSIQL